MAERGTCFSTAVIWRCSALRMQENELLMIGPAIQLLFGLLLIFTNWKSKRHSHLFLTAEAVFNFSFALLELFSRILAAAQHNFAVFNIIDIVLAAGSFLPLLFYSLFIFALLRTQIIYLLPQRFQNLVKVLFLLFIPAILALDELSSFIGVQRTQLVLDPNSSQTTIAIGFNPGSSGQTSWSFFTSFTLVLLTVYQALAFCLVFFRLIMVAINQRNIEYTGSDQGTLYGGIGWTSAGLKVGAIETVLGFVGPSFGLQMTRRSLKALSRALLAIGIAKGSATVEDFSQLQDELGAPNPGFRRSRLMATIGNPRHSTFQSMSPTATAFHTTPGSRAAQGKSPLATTRPDMREFAALKGTAQARERVTVLYDRGAPMLHMRFSQLDMPDPRAIVDNVKSRPSTVFVEEVAAIKRSKSIHESAEDPFIDPGRPSTHRAGDSMADSMNTLKAVQELTSQFPGLPPHPGQSRTGIPDDARSRSSSRSSASSVFTQASSQLMPPPKMLWQGAPVPSPVKEEASEYGRDSGYYDDGPSMSAAGYAHSEAEVISPDTGLSRFTQPVYESRPTSLGAESLPESPVVQNRDSTPQVWLHRKPIDAHMDQLAQSVMAETRSSWATNQPPPDSAESHTFSVEHRAPQRRPTLSSAKGGFRERSVHLQLEIQPPPPETWQHHGIVEIDYSESPSYDGDKLLKNVLRDDEALAINSSTAS